MESAKEGLERLSEYFDSELNFVYNKKKLAPRDMESKLFVDVFLEILRSNNACDVFDRSVVWPGIAGDIEACEYNASFFKRGDSGTHLKLELTSGRYSVDGYTNDITYQSKMSLFCKKVFLGPRMGKLEDDYETTKEELVRIGRAVFGL